MTLTSRARYAIIAGCAVFALAGCGFNPYALPLPGGADVGDNPFTVKVHFRDVLDLVPQSSVQVDDVSVGMVRSIELGDNWTAVVTLELNNNVNLPDNAIATIAQTSLLGEKYVSLAPPEQGKMGHLGQGDVIPLANTGRNPEVEEVLGALSLLFNGGGIENVKTITTELGKSLDGREPEIKDLLDQTNELVGQLAANKDAIVHTLEQVNRLAVETNKQKAAITGALDDLPDALRVVNQQRDDLVKLFVALDHLGDVGTRVVKESKEDVIRDLKLLEPTIRQFANAGDDLPETLSTLLTFPFTDGAVGGAGSIEAAKQFNMGEYGNLSIHLELSAANVTQLLGLAGGAPLPGAPAPGIPGVTSTQGQNDSSSADSSTADSSTANPVQKLVGLVAGLVPSASTGQQAPVTEPGGQPTGATPTAPGSQSPAPEQGSTTQPGLLGGLGLPKFCSLLGSCRTAPASYSDPVYSDAIGSDLGKMLVAVVVNK